MSDGKRLSKKDLIELVAQKMDKPKVEVEPAVNAVFDTLKEQLAQDNQVAVDKFGTFTKKHRAARTGTKPGTSEPMEIAAKNVVHFKAGKAFNEAIN